MLIISKWIVDLKSNSVWLDIISTNFKILNKKTSKIISTKEDMDIAFFINIQNEYLQVFPNKASHKCLI